jgi:hypothetical protein
MKRELTPDVLETRSGGYPAFIGVVRKGEGGNIVWRSTHARDRRDWAWEDAERGMAAMEQDRSKK